MISMFKIGYHEIRFTNFPISLSKLEDSKDGYLTRKLIHLPLPVMLSLEIRRKELNSPTNGKHNGVYVLKSSDGNFQNLFHPVY